VFNWENEVAVVKQSASMFIGGLLPCIPMLLLTIGIMLVPSQYIDLAMFIFCIMVLGIAFLLYRRNCKVNLLDI
jgi:ABC-2 type transport system permease protein